MTKNSATKRAARRRAIAERVSYTAARRRENAATVTSHGGPVVPRPPLIRPAHWSLEQVSDIAETLSKISGAHVVRQHVVSQTVLRNFTEKVEGAPRVGLYD